jgi:predicted metalloprotease with PDZ domain
VNDEAQLLYSARGDWDSWRRGVDFYDEGDLIWLEADVTIRKLTNGVKSLDDFCKAFHGGEGGKAEVKPYTFDDVVNTLNTIAANDWKAFFKTRITDVAPHAPLGGIEGGGWKLAYSETPSSLQQAELATSGGVDARYSLGLSLGSDGTVYDVLPGSPADKAKLGPGMVVTNVNGAKFSGAALREALKRGKTDKAPLQLAATNNSEHATYALDYHGGERYPVLERDASKPDVLTAIISRGRKQ